MSQLFLSITYFPCKWWLAVTQLMPKHYHLHVSLALWVMAVTNNLPSSNLHSGHNPNPLTCCSTNQIQKCTESVLMKTIPNQDQEKTRDGKTSL